MFFWQCRTLPSMIATTSGRPFVTLARSETKQATLTPCIQPPWDYLTYTVNRNNSGLIHNMWLTFLSNGCLPEGWEESVESIWHCTVSDNNNLSWDILSEWFSTPLPLFAQCILLVSQQAMLDASSTACCAALTSTSGAPARHQQRLKIINNQTITICALKSSLFRSLMSTCFVYPPCPDRSRNRLCVSLPSNISKVYLPLSFSVGLEIIIQTSCALLPGFVLASWSILFSLNGQKYKVILCYCFVCFRQTFKNQIHTKTCMLKTYS